VPGILQYSWSLSPLFGPRFTTLWFLKNHYRACWVVVLTLRQRALYLSAIQYRLMYVAVLEQPDDEGRIVF
jgi:hypothetical protein